MENLGIDPKLLLAQVINFLLFFFIVKKFILKPFSVFLDQEKKQEKDKSDTLAKIKKQEEDLVIQESKLKEKAKKELEIILEQAKKDGQQIRSDMLKQAEQDAEEIKSRIKKQLDEEKENLYKEVKEKIADVSIQLVNEGLKDTLDAETKKKITVRILKNITAKAVQEN